MFARIAQDWQRMSTPRKIRRVFMLTLAAIGVWALTPYLYNRQVDEAFPAAAPQPAAAGQASAPGPAAAPVALVRGEFTRVDAVHAAEGTATVYRLPDGKLSLRLENFESTNGPDLFVGLSGHPQPRNTVEVHQGGYRELEALKANQGNQNYELPADLDPAAFKSVVIYCRAFHVVFSTADLSAS